MPSASVGVSKASPNSSVRDSVDALELELANISALLPRSVPGAPRLRSPYTVSEAVTLDEIEKKAAAKLSSVCPRVLRR